MAKLFFVLITNQFPYEFSAAIDAPGVQDGFDSEPRVFTNWQNWSLTPYADWQNFNAIQSLNSTWGPYFKPVSYTHLTLPTIYSV